MQIKRHNLYNNSKAQNINLLKARLYFDGGYSKLALEELQKIKSPTLLNDSKNNIEYYYRLGRCMEQMENYELAIKHYNKTIKSGSKEYYYFAAKSALQLLFT